MVRSAIFLAVILVLSYFSVNRRSNTQYSDVTIFADIAMTVPYRITIGKTLNDKEREKVQKIIREAFKEIDAIYNKWNPLSELSRLNQMKAGEVSKISSGLEALLLQAQHLVELTEGRFDPSIEPIQKIWKEALEKGTIPDQKSIQEASLAVGWKNIHINNGTFVKDHDKTSIDLGGIAKGFLVDDLVEKLNQAGFPDVLVDWGGELKAAGKHPTGRNWNIFIARLGDSDPQHAAAEIPLNDQAIATSGDYQQIWTVRNEKGEEVQYFHIINPFTLQPLIARKDSIASVSVLAENCAFADGLATAGMMFDTAEEAQLWAESIRKDFPKMTFWFILNN